MKQLNQLPARRAPRSQIALPYAPLRSFFCIGLVLVLASCSKPVAPAPTQPTQRDLSTVADCSAPDLKLNELQSIGSHNSYKRAIPRLELLALRIASPEAAYGLDYSHRPLSEQLNRGMRQLELDVFYDPQGGLYAEPYLPGAIPWVGKRYDVPEMTQPGFKVMHAQDVDQRSHCALFTHCLATIRTWSAAHPQHTPILILINAKQDTIELDEAVTPLAFTTEAFDALDAEIRAQLPADKLITPDDVRGSAPTLRDAVRQNGWPRYADSQGKFIFALDEKPAVVATYLRGQPSLDGLPMFVNSVDDAADHAAYFTLNDPVGDADTIRQAVSAGFLVRTRADANTVEARNNDTRRRTAALASGAQYVSTDYYVPRTSFSDYRVGLPNQAVTRCRP